MNIVSKRSCCLSKSPSVSVWLSKSQCVYENIAFEDYLYENRKFAVKERLLFIWRNRPSIVIGRHQNPWKEVDLLSLHARNVNLCRRNSGGGAVYHDTGNVNLTFFTHRNVYNRKENLKFITEFFRREFNRDLRINQKDDIVLDSKYKVSGTAAKLGLSTAYHHCTLLCNTNLKAMSGLLRNSFGYIETNATASVPSSTKNIFDGNFNFTKLFSKLATDYNKTYGGQKSRLSTVIPTDFPIEKKVEHLKTWEWTYGKSPKFTVSGKFINIETKQTIQFLFTVYKGRIKNIELGTNQHQVFDCVKDKPFDHTSIYELVKNIGFLITFD